MLSLITYSLDILTLITMCSVTVISSQTRCQYATEAVSCEFDADVELS